ncbi:MAG TPA: serine hydrolase [Solirubrobacteraceae bacterium]|jgi:D-alanyl-D-alanine carboxypeptidase|nr:serine hydrolase [Solirubrobacteraceae bacterium]
MSTSPFMTPTQSRERRTRAARRRRRRRTGSAVAVLAAVLAVGLTMALAKDSGASKHPHRTSHPSHARAHAPATVSQLGLPLGRPPLTLGGLADAAADPVRIPFHHPPRAGILFNLDTGQVLWQRDAHERLRIASLTKMMTALLTVEAEPAATPVPITRLAVDQNGSKVGVLPLGRHVRLETLLYGLMLPSGNDAAYALAQRVAVTIPAFVARMNEEAAHLGMSCTRYSSPSGYYDAHNYSCAADLAELAEADLAQPRIARVVRTYTAALPFPIKGGKLYLTNNNPMLIYHYPGATGLKTGWTIAAGRCLVATAERGGVRLGVVLLNSTEPGTQARKLLDHAFADVYDQAPVAETPFPPGA